MNPKEFFYLPKSDRRVIVVLLALAAIVTAAIFLLSGEGGKTTGVQAADDSISRAVSPVTGRYLARRHSRAAYPPHQYYYGEGGVRHELFPFDPNTADSTQLLRLGLRPWQVKNIYKYRARGGVYRQPQDFARLYGLTVEDYRRLEPYIRIEGDFRPAAEVIAVEQTASRDTVTYPVKLKPAEHLSLNTADTAQLRKVPGIGRYYAREIDRYRQRLGGFISTRQLLEIENFPEEALPYFTLDASQVKRLNLNKLTLNELKRHPYINFYQARAISDYRRLKGPLKSLSDLSLLPDFTPQDIERLRPYVEF